LWPAGVGEPLSRDRRERRNPGRRREGIATGIAGKFKELAGELMEDPELEAKGIAQQEESEEIRSGNA
jgi:uncharacterized protein YjbJ (UPF0337 family)